MSEETQNDLLSTNKDLVDILKLISNYYVMSDDNYRAKSFATASYGISNYEQKIRSGKHARSVIKGVGESIADVIDEYINTGTVKRLNELETKFSEQKQTIDYFKSFYGIGPVTAIKYYNQGFRTLSDLWTKADLTDAQKIGILWRDHLNERISRNKMDIINNKISSILDPKGIRWTIAGSYRRQEESSGDVDVLVEEKNDLSMYDLVDLMKEILPATLAQGPTKYMGVIRLSEEYLGHRIDIRLINKDSYGAALMYFTGSQQFNILMRRRALQFGLTLNEYGLYDSKNKQQPVNTEKDIFDILHVKYLQPVDRTKTIAELEYEYL